jgi:hypothetical protein
MKRETVSPQDRVPAAGCVSDSVSGPIEMPVYRFRSIEEMKATRPRLAAGDPRLAVVFSEIQRLGRALHPRRFPPGVYRNRSIEDADRRAAGWLADEGVAGPTE